MSRKTMFGALAVAAGVAAAIAVKLYKDAGKTDEDVKDEDDAVHFITIESEEDEKKETDAEDLNGQSEEVKEVCAVFSYLKPAFVEEVLVKDQEFKTLKGEDELVCVTHHVSFGNTAELEQYVAIMDEAGYTIEVDGMDAKVSRKFFAQTGAITSDILNVANQTVALDGVYHSFEVE